MEIIPEALDINFPGQTRKIGRRIQLHLETECQIIAPVRIGQILDRSLRSLADAIEKHDGSRRLSIHLIDHVKAFIDPIPVQIQDDLDGGILLKNPRDPVQGLCIRFIPVQLSVLKVID